MKFGQTATEILERVECGFMRDREITDCRSQGQCMYSSLLRLWGCMRKHVVCVGSPDLLLRHFVPTFSLTSVIPPRSAI
jgi:hypothetical protein